MRLALLLALIVACVCGCSIPEAPTPGQLYVLSPEGAWTQAERAELTIACDEWRVWSDGLLDCRIGTPGDARIVRGATGTAKLGRVDAMDAALIVDADGLASVGYPLNEGVRAITQHLIGKAAGMALHAGPGVMSLDDVRSEFTEADRASCRAAGFCG